MQFSVVRNVGSRYYVKRLVLTRGGGGGRVNIFTRVISVLGFQVLHMSRLILACQRKTSKELCGGPGSVRNMSVGKLAFPSRITTAGQRQCIRAIFGQDLGFRVLSLIKEVAKDVYCGWHSGASTCRKARPSQKYARYAMSP